jgi:phenylpyruvate tautomerase PptA (4-oxalocrotonate tautomerase family)
MAGTDPDPSAVARLWARLVLAYTDPAFRDDFAADLTDLLVTCAGAPLATVTRVVDMVDLDSLDYAGDDLDLEDAEDAAYDLLVGLRSDVVAEVVLRGDADAADLVATARGIDARYDAVLDVIDDLPLASMDDFVAAGWPADGPAGDRDPRTGFDVDATTVVAPPEPTDEPFAAPPPRRRRWFGGS